MKEYIIHYIDKRAFSSSFDKNAEKHIKRRPEFSGALFYEKDGIFYTDIGLCEKYIGKCKEIFANTIILDGCEVRVYDTICKIGRIRLIYSDDLSFFKRRLINSALLKGPSAISVALISRIFSYERKMIVHTPFILGVSEWELVFEFLTLDASLRERGFSKFFSSSLDGS